MKSHQVLKLNNFRLATREKFLIVLNVIMLISRRVSDKFNDDLERNTDISGSMPCHQSRVNFDWLPGDFPLTLNTMYARV